MSAAHVLMLIAGLLAFLLVLVVLRDRGAVVSVAVATAPLEPGATLDAGDVRFVELPAAISELEGIVGPSTLETGDGWRVASGVPAGALLRATDLVAGSDDPRRLMSFALESSQAVGGAVGTGDVIDVVAVRDGQAAFAATGLVVAAVDSADGPGRANVTFTVGVDRGEDLKIAEALADAEVHVVRAPDG